MSIRKLGWNRQSVDHRDFKYEMTNNIVVPAEFYLPNVTTIKEQLDLGCCTGFGICGAYEIQIKNPPFLSRLFVYYNERVIEDTVFEDSGANIRDGIKSIASQGIASNAMCPYIISNFTVKPSAKAYRNALNFKIGTYQSLDNSNATVLKNALVNGYSIVFGFTVFESFENISVTKTGIIPMPLLTEKALGGHCVQMVGYKPGYFKCQNSWGTAWGDKGYFWMPEQYITSQNCSDFWVFNVVPNVIKKLSFCGTLQLQLKNLFTR